MSTTKNEVKVKLIYEDGDDRTYKMEIEPENMSTVKARVKEINNQTGTGAQYNAPMKATFVSDTGAPMMKIGAVTIETTTEEVIYGE